MPMLLSTSTQYGFSNQRRPRPGPADRPPRRPMPSSAVLHTFSATRSPNRPVGRTIRIRIRTRKAMASFQAMEM